MIDSDSIAQLDARFSGELAAAKTERDLIAIRDRYVGRKSGEISALLKAMGSAAGVRPHAAGAAEPASNEKIA